MNRSDILIAVVDDEVPVCKAFERLLRASGFHVETFTSGGAFLEAVSTHNISCVVLDLDMPNVNGFDVQESLKKTGHQIPIIVVTGHDIPDARARTNGAAFYLRKPIDSDILVDAVIATLAMQKPL